MELSTNYTHDSELQVIRAPSPISAPCGVFTRRFLLTASNNGYFFCSVLKSRTELTLNSESVRVRVTLRLEVYRQSVRLGDKPLTPTISNFIFQLNTCGNSPYVISSQTRGCACSLQLLLVLASTLIFRSESRGTHSHILLLHIRDSPNQEGQVPVFISPPEQGSPVISPSPPTTRRAHLHTRLTLNSHCHLLIAFQHEPRRDTPFPPLHA
jgi:hypothetical protein